jgi:hypothetical protein
MTARTAAARPKFMRDDRRWFARHPHADVRRRPPIEGEFPPELLADVPDGYRLEVLVQMRSRFTNGDSLRLRWPILVPIEEGLQ